MELESGGEVETDWLWLTLWYSRFQTFLPLIDSKKPTPNQSNLKKKTVILQRPLISTMTSRSSNAHKQISWWLSPWYISRFSKHISSLGRVLVWRILGIGHLRWHMHWYLHTVKVTRTWVQVMAKSWRVDWSSAVNTNTLKHTIKPETVAHTQAESYPTLAFRRVQVTLAG